MPLNVEKRIGIRRLLNPMQYQFTQATWRAPEGLLIIGLLAAVVMVACSSDESPDQPATAASGDVSAPAATARPAVKSESPQAGPLSGEIVIDGSSTVYPVTVAAAEDFRKEHPQVQIPVGISGTGGGFKKFTAGETVVSDASRPIKDSERELAAQNGITFIELAVAYDGLSVLVNPDNDWASCLTTDQLHEIWKPDSEITSWNQVDPSYPNLDIVLYGPDADSGTFDYFTEEINGDTGIIRDDFFPAVDDNVLVQGIAGDRGALGYFRLRLLRGEHRQVEARRCRRWLQVVSSRTKRRSTTVLIRRSADRSTSTSTSRHSAGPKSKRSSTTTSRMPPTSPPVLVTSDSRSRSTTRWKPRSPTRNRMSNSSFPKCRRFRSHLKARSLSTVLRRSTR